MSSCIAHVRVGALSLVELDDGGGPRFVVIAPERFRVRFCPDPQTGTISAGIEAEWSDDRPGQLANYTPAYESGFDDYVPGEATITDDGLLSVLSQRLSASRIVIRTGWTAQLPVEAVELVRRAIALAEACATGRLPEAGDPKTGRAAA